MKAICLEECQYGRLKVLRRAVDSKKKGVVWVCECECGNLVEVPTQRLRAKRGPTRSCGCLRKENNRAKHWKGCGQLGMDYWRRFIRNANARNIPFLLSIEEAWEIYVKQGGRCALTNVPIGFPKNAGKKHRASGTASLDRIDSSRGYERGNVQWVHKTVNIMKNNLDESEFVYWCQLVCERTNGRDLAQH